jgi:nucleoside-diphosphate-sugar epimerase
MPQETRLPPEMSPSRYIEKVSLLTGEALDSRILPRHLLVHSHRDYHVLDVHARLLMSRVIRATGDEDLARQRVKSLHRRGRRAAQVLARALRRSDPEKVARNVFGLRRRQYYFRFKKPPHTPEEVEEKIARLRAEATEKLDAVRHHGRPRLTVLLTGGTGFVGQEILWQAAHDDAVAEMVVLIRPKQVVDRATGEVVSTQSAEERGRALLDRLWLAGTPAAGKFRFIAGDVERERLGIDDDEHRRLASTLTHVIHCAASVAFDDPYAESFRANVEGSLNALGFSLGLQGTSGSPFVAHLAIETSYIHGRQTRDAAREDEVVFPRNFYNNFYELTKAMASIETERFMLDEGLRVVQLCPAIVIGEARTGNNRGDTKVVNAPVNVFGRAHQALSSPGGAWFERTRAAMLARMACIFPGDPSAELNLIPVDRVVAGILAALRRPEAIGERIHLATDNRITSEQIRDIVAEELGVAVKLAEPTLHRNVTLPVLTRVLKTLRQERLAGALEKLGTIFAGYSEWGQPVHEVGNDVRVLGLSDERPRTEHAFRMLCRHNRYVQEFGKVRDPDEVSRRERVWLGLIEDLERRAGGAVGAMPAAEFQRALAEELDLERFERR